MIIAKRTVSSIVFVVSTLALVSCGTSGNSRSDEFNGRVYIGAGALISDLEPDENGVTDFTVDDTESAGGTVLLGYDINSVVSIEGHYSDLGEATFDPEGEIDYQVGAVSALLYFANNFADRSRREGFSLFGRVGVGVLENDSDVIEFEQVNDAHLLLGLGAEYGFGNGLGIRLEGVSHDEDINYGQLGLVYRFGSSAPRRRAAPPAPVPAPREPAETASTAAPAVTPEPEPLDSDNDGIVDTDDQCNSTVDGTPIGTDGCAYFKGAIDGLGFASSSDELTGDARTILDEVVDVLKQFPDARISIGAHTDSTGPGQQNLDLSKLRAISVTRYLVEQGIDGSRLAPRAFGESQPIQSNETAPGRAANRRVELNLL